MAFEVFTRSRAPFPKEPAVTIHKRGLLSLNGAAFLALDRPLAVTLMFDREVGTIGLQPVDVTVADCRFVRQGSSGPNGPFLISAIAFLRYYDLRLPQALRWPAELREGVLCVDVSGPGQPVTSNRSMSQAGPPQRLVTAVGEPVVGGTGSAVDADARDDIGEAGLEKV
jgi:hypothetical protein